MNLYYLAIIVTTLVGFSILAWMLLAPIWRFLDREEEVSQEWTKEALARRRRRQQQQKQQRNGSPSAHEAGDGQAGDGTRGSGYRPEDAESQRPPASSGDGAPASPGDREGDHEGDREHHPPPDA